MFSDAAMKDWPSDENDRVLQMLTLNKVDFRHDDGSPRWSR